MITVEPVGGLGNQLFSYGLGLANATRLGVDLAVDLSRFRKYKWHEYQLDTFESSITQTNFGDFTSRAEGLVASLALRIPVIRPDVLRIGRLNVEIENRFEPKLLQLAEGDRLRGYFQSWKYLEGVAGKLRDQVTSIRNPGEWFLSKRRELENLGPWIGLHMRLGNYLSLDGMGVAGEHYYSRALGLLRAMSIDLPVVVFSDSPDIAKKSTLWREPTEVYFVDPPLGSTPLESMILLSEAHHLIIGNSTFSWWAGWLDDNSPYRTVIYPRPWLDLPQWNDRDLAVPGWIGLSRESFDDYRMVE